jgi:hypothetical protein
VRIRAIVAILAIFGLSFGVLPAAAASAPSVHSNVPLSSLDGWCGYWAGVPAELRPPGPSDDFDKGQIDLSGQIYGAPLAGPTATTIKPGRIVHIALFTAAGLRVNAEWGWTERINPATGNVDYYQYCFDDLAPGVYKVRFSLDSTDGSGRESWVQWWERKADSASATVLKAVKEGSAEWWYNSNQANATVTEGGRITGNVRAEQAGNVLGFPIVSLGPLKNALVSLVSTSGATVATTMTTAAGDYAFDAVRPGMYQVHFWGGGKYADEWWNDKPTAVDAATLWLRAGATIADRNAILTADAARHALSPSIPSVVGATEVGETLRAIPGTWAPAPVAVSYQWNANGVPIPGATGTTLLLTEGQLAKKITVSVTGAKGGYTTIVRTSAAVGPVTLKRLDSVTPYIDGDPAVGTPLSAVTLPWGPDLVALSYRWSADGVPIAGATGTSYLPAAADVGTLIAVTVTGTKPGYQTESRTSAPTAPVTIKTLTPTPVPKITGQAQVGATLTAKPGTWGPGAVDLAYQWKADGTIIPGATSATYVPTTADNGKQLTVTVTGSKTGYTTVSKTSKPTEHLLELVLVPAPVPTISGAPEVGGTLQSAPGVWGPDPVALAYQWAVDGAPVAGATGATYSPVLGDVGRTVTVTVTGSKLGYGTLSRTSAPTSAVLQRYLDPVSTPTIEGDPVFEGTLYADPGRWGPEPVTLRYEWEVNGVVVSRDQRYTIGLAEIGQYANVTVTGSKPGFPDASRTSEISGRIQPAEFRIDEPYVTPPPSGIYTRVVFYQVVAPPWSPNALLTYQWRLDGVDVPGATGPGLAATSATNGKRVTVLVTGSMAGYRTTTVEAELR